MSGPFGSSQWMYSSGGFYPTTIDQSLRFNDDDSAYLSWTPASAGNRKTWTWSGWVKRGNLTGNQRLFAAGANTNNTTDFSFGNGDLLQIRNRISSTNTYRRQTSMEFRDPSAWYHIIVVFDTTQATADDRIKLYVNGSQITSWSIDTIGSQNQDTFVSNTTPHYIGVNADASAPDLDGYLAEINFIDGTALGPTDFGEFKSGVWVAKKYTGSYGTNGFYLPFKPTTVANGFNAVTYTGNGGTQSIEGVGFSPDFVWIKERGDVADHKLYDTVRGATKVLESSQTGAEGTDTNGLTAFNSDGFTLGSSGTNNGSGDTYVGWCWDAGSGSPVSNTDGSITSSVKSNTAYGFSVVSYTGTGSNATVGHGLGVAPEMIILKDRTSGIRNWRVYHESIGATDVLSLNLTDATSSSSTVWNDTAPTSSVFSIGSGNSVNNNGNDYIAYCFAEISGYSSFGSYSGTGASGNKITTGFKPAFVMVKRTDSTGQWFILDGTRDVSDPRNLFLTANSSDDEKDLQVTDALDFVDFNSDGFTLKNGGAFDNASGGTYIYMAFADTRDAAFWRDLSGNDNTWQPNYLQNSDVMLDSPTQNWCVLNPLVRTVSTISNGNLQAATPLSNTDWAALVRGNFAIPTSGKWYFEVFNGGGTLPNQIQVGIASSYINDATIPQNYAWYNNTNYFAESGSASGKTAPSTNDVISCAIDVDSGSITWYLNNVSQGSFSYTLSGKQLFPVIGDGSNSAAITAVANFGQDSSFAGNKTAQGNTDDNGVGDFFYAPPSGFLALAAQNLPTPAIDPAQDDVPADYFNTVLYTGDGSTDRQITSVGFQPDWVWFKNRSVTKDHKVFDAVRGAGESLETNTTDSELTTTGQLISFDADGFTINDNSHVNASSEAYVAWNWLAGNGTSSNTDGSITSTVSVNQKAGFAVVGYTGNGTAGATVGHGLGVVPDVIIVKNRTQVAGQDWAVYHHEMHSSPENKLMFLNLTNAVTDSNSPWNDTAPTSSVITLGSGNITNNAYDYIAYCFAEIEGYSKFGSYTGNGSTDGPFVYTGFEVAWLLIKKTNNTGAWVLVDNKRGEINAVDEILQAHVSNAELTGTDRLDIVSNGFKLRTDGGAYNASGDTYIYMAFAENPFKYANAR